MCNSWLMWCLCVCSGLLCLSIDTLWECCREMFGKESLTLRNVCVCSWLVGIVCTVWPCFTLCNWLCAAVDSCDVCVSAIDYWVYRCTPFESSAEKCSGRLTHFSPSMLWRCRVCCQASKSVVSEMTYTVSDGTLNSTQQQHFQICTMQLNMCNSWLMWCLCVCSWLLCLSIHTIWECCREMFGKESLTLRNACVSAVDLYVYVCTVWPCFRYVLWN